MVLLLFLFLPEVWGALSHLSRPNSRELGGYRIPIPTSWIVLGHDDQPGKGESRVTGLAGQGPGLGVAPYFHGLPFSAWDIKIERSPQSNETQTTRWIPRENELIGRRDFTIGGQSVTCFDYWPSYVDRPVRFQDSSDAYVQCSGASGFYASLIGRRDKIPVFYNMLNGITQKK